MITLADLRREFRPMLRLAAPLAIAELGWMFMGIVDILMAGRSDLGPIEIVVPIDSQSRTNAVLTASTGG